MSSVIIVVNNPKDWPLEVPDVEVVSSRNYLTRQEYGQRRGAKVFNLCRSYRYQSLGYYVSLLGTARGHKPLPSIATIQDLKSSILVRYASEELEELIHKSLEPIQSDKFTLSIYFGHNLARRHDRLSSKLFKLFPAPLLRADFAREEGQWELKSIRPIPASEIPEEHRPAVVEFAKEFFQRKFEAESLTRLENGKRYDMAILYDPKADHKPSTIKTIQKFTRIAEKAGFEVEEISKDDYGRLAEFDALFIRETTSVNHHTYRFARRAAAEGVVVIDDPESILLCTNKVFLAELLARNNIGIPKTVILHRDNVDTVGAELGFPLILKQPDSAFSQGVKKVSSAEELEVVSDEMLEDSELIIAQEFLPTPFDWRIGIIEREPLFACKYHMSGKHWQIVQTDEKGETDYGKVEAVPLYEVPTEVLNTALKAANLIGDGLYGVDLKHVNGRTYVIEVNDNPNLDTGYEDTVIKDALYQRIVDVFLKRIEAKKKRPV